MQSLNYQLLMRLIVGYLLLMNAALAISIETEQKEDSTGIIKSHGIAMHGLPKYPASFERFDYTSPLAQKGGKLRLFNIGTFDSLNDFIPKGTAASNTELLYDSLLVQSYDEPFTKYGLVAHTIEYPSDRSWVIFHLRPEAKFHDEHPITAEDLVFSFNLLKEQGNPIYRFYFADVENVEALSPHSVKYSFKNSENRELALSVGSLPILPQHFWNSRDFAKSSLEVPLGSGPYQITKVDPGRHIHYQRVKEYWGKDLPVNNGFYNFDAITVDYYRDNNIALEALKAGEYDFRRENSSKFWATAYDIPAVETGRLLKQEIAHNANNGLQAFVYNLRNPIFQDKALRKAISYAFDFEWSNQTLFYQAYDRSYSYFTNSAFSATGLPDEKELALLLPYKDQLPASVFTEAYSPPKTDGSGFNRPNLRIAKKILDDAGYYVKDNQLYNAQEQPIRFEILLRSQGFERIVNPFLKDLSRLGIIARIRLVDTSQYINRTRSFRFDMMVKVFPQSESPGNEQRNFWGSESALTEGSNNIIGIQNPVIDALIEHVVKADNREQLITATRALDRVLLNHHYMVPQWYKSANRIVYWNKFGLPDTSPVYDRYYTQAIYTWWYDADKNTQLQNP